MHKLKEFKILGIAFILALIVMVTHNMHQITYTDQQVIKNKGDISFQVEFDTLYNYEFTKLESGNYALFINGEVDGVFKYIDLDGEIVLSNQWCDFNFIFDDRGNLVVVNQTIFEQEEYGIKEQEIQFKL